MDGSLEAPPIVLRGGRWRGVWVLVVFTILIAVQFPVALRPETDLTTSSVLIVFCSFFVILGLWMVISPAKLVISPSGVQQTALWRKRSYGWDEICNFRPTAIGPYSRTAVGFDFVDEGRARGLLGKLNASVAGVDGVFQRGWKVKPPALAQLLNEARNRWLEGAAPAAGAAHESAPAAAGAGSAVGALAGARMNRKVYWIITGILMLVSVGLALVNRRGLSGGAAGPTIVWIWVYGRRLHDIGRSAWWQLAIYAAEIVVLIALMAAGVPETEAVGAGLIVHLLCAVVLGSIPGDKAANRFGPPPGTRAAATVAETFR